MSAPPPTDLNLRAPHIICDRDVGLFNLILTAIAHIHWANSQGRVPVAYYTSGNCYWTASPYRDADTVWEYYFEPIVAAYPASAIPSHVRASIANPPEGGWGLGRFLDGGEFVSGHPSGPEVFGNSLKGHRWLNPALRRRASAIIQDHVRPRPYILDIVNTFVREHFSGQVVIGVHVRGTDALSDPKRPLIEDRPNFQRYFTMVDRLIRRHPSARIFVASDEHSSVASIRDRFGDRVVAFDSIRHGDGVAVGKGPKGGRMPAYLTETPDRAARSGEEAVVEYLLLCRCSYFIHNGSNIARTVLLTMPGIRAFNAIAGHIRRRRTARDWWFRLRTVKRVFLGRPISRWYAMLGD